jgi:hypothetical protein
MGLSTARTCSLVGGNASSCTRKFVDVVIDFYVRCRDRGICTGESVRPAGDDLDGGHPPRLRLYHCGGWEKVVILHIPRFICFPLPQAGQVGRC